MNYLQQEEMVWGEKSARSSSCPIEHELTQTANDISLRKTNEEKLGFRDLCSLLPEFTGFDSRIYGVYLPLIKTHHHFFASRLGLAAEHKALFGFPFF